MRLKSKLAQPGTYQELGFEERLSLLTAEELTCRENRKAERLIKHARFRLNAELSKLDYRNNRGLGQGPHPFTQSGKLVNPETKYFTDRGHRQR
nr:ATP-binding protein [Escherichia coli]